MSGQAKLCDLGPQSFWLLSPNLVVHMFACGLRLLNSVCHLCVLVCLLCWHTTASVPDVAQDAYRAMEFQTLWTIVKQELATSPTDP